MTFQKNSNIKKGQAHLVVLSAPSGTGKTTVYKKALPLIENLVLSVSCTTRQPRVNEVEGVDYSFLTKEKFQEMIEKEAFIEWAEVHGNYYGTPKSFIEESLEKKIHVLLDIDVQGATQIRTVSKVYRPIFIFLVPPSMEELERRLRDRKTETEADIQKRLRNAKQEIGFQDQYDYVIINDELDMAVADFIEIIKSL